MARNYQAVNFERDTITGYRDWLINSTNIKDQTSKQVIANEYIRVVRFMLKTRKFIRPLEVFDRMLPRLERADVSKYKDLIYEQILDRPFVKIQLNSAPFTFNPSGGVAIVSTPRSGNTICQKLLEATTGMNPIGFHSFEDMRFNEIDQPHIYQIHCYPDEALKYINNLNLKVLCLSRHPFDVLVSALHFIPNQPQTMYWLDGAIVSDHLKFKEMTPASKQFLDWALGSSGEALLGISKEWQSKDAIKIRYEDLISQPEDTFEHVLDEIDYPINDELRQKITQIMQSGLKNRQNQHFWRGKSGNFQQLIPAEYVELLYNKYKGVFETLGYEKPVSTLSGADAEHNWSRMV